MERASSVGVLKIVGPGLLVAATGVGAGDLATATFTGGVLGTAVLWAVLVGAGLKFALNEGLARWQLATDTTFLEGVHQRLGPIPIILFLPYFLLWSYFVGAALISASGVSLHALIPVFDDPAQGKVVFGIVASLVGAAFVVVGGYRWFSRIMSVCIGVMFVTVVATAILLWPGTGKVLSGLVPTTEVLQGSGLTWTLALIGGVGGTVTVLCYGYWIREENRCGLQWLKPCRLDLGVGYGMTAVFGLAMVIIGSTISVEGRGARLIVTLADALEGPLGPVARGVFLVGAFGAIFSSLLGVWQAVPYLFADMVGLLHHGRGDAVNTRSWVYRGYLAALAVVPMLGLGGSFKEAQKIYAVAGAAFMPVLALALLAMGGNTAWVGRGGRNGVLSFGLLGATLVFFGWMAVRKWGGV